MYENKLDQVFKEILSELNEGSIAIKEVSDSKHKDNIENILESAISDLME